MEGVGRKPIIEQGNSAVMAVPGNYKNHTERVEKLELIVDLLFLHLGEIITYFFLDFFGGLFLILMCGIILI